MALVAIFVALLALCAWIAIPAAVPFTMQTFGVFFTVGTLGGKRGTLAVLVYILLGVMGAPVFSGFSGGIAALFGPTGGYVLGFLLSALFMWSMELLGITHSWVRVVSMAAGLLVCYCFGTLWFVLVYTQRAGEISLWMALTWCVLPYVIPDAVKVALAYLLSVRLRRIVAL